MLAALLLPLVCAAPTKPRRDVDTSYPYKGPQIPVGDPVNPTLDGSKGGFPRLWEAPAVTPPPGVKVSNNINVISTALFPGGVNVHFQTPFGIGGAPKVKFGCDPKNLDQEAEGSTTS
jgi:acid phosphatase